MKITDELLEKMTEENLKETNWFEIPERISRRKRKPKR